MLAKLRQLVLIFLLAAVSAHAAPPTALPPDVTASQRLLFTLLNQERTQRGLQPLQWDPALAASALYHAGQMADHGAISHQFSGEPDLTARDTQAHAHFSRIAENVALVSDVHSAHDEWMQSPGHRANILDPDVDSVGIALVQRDGRFYAVQDFSRGVASLDLTQEAQQIAKLLSVKGVPADATQSAARQACSGKWSASVQPAFTMRWTSTDLTQLPERLNQQLAAKKYSSAWVAACQAQSSSGFSIYSIAVFLFNQPPQ
jgi:uncharacterized protein YkwD